MNKEAKVLWVAALRSGAYRQIFDHVIGGTPWDRCAVGVLTSLPSTTGYPSTYFLTDKELSKVLDMNDRERKTFAEIADYVEANL